VLGWGSKRVGTVRTVIFAVLGASIVCGVGWLTLGNPVGDAWRRDLLELPPLGAPARGDSGHRRGRRQEEGRHQEATRGQDRVGQCPRLARVSRHEARRRPGRRGAAACAGRGTGHSPGALRSRPQPDPAEEDPTAIAELEKCIAINPRHALAYRAMGMAHTMVGRTDSATKAFEKFLELAPDHKDAPKVRATVEAYRRGSK